MEILHTIAEVSVALTGFAGIVFIFSNSGTLSQISLWRVQNLLLGTIMTLMVALTALGFESTSIPKDSWGSLGSWILAAGICVIFYSAAVGYVRHNVGATSRLGKRAFFPIMFAVVIVFLAQLLNGFGFFDARSEAVFVYGLLAMLLFNAIQFLISVLDQNRVS